MGGVCNQPTLPAGNRSSTRMIPSTNGCGNKITEKIVERRRGAIRPVYWPWNSCFEVSDTRIYWYDRMIWYGGFSVVLTCERRHRQHHARPRRRRRCASCRNPWKGAACTRARRKEKQEQEHDAAVKGYKRPSTIKGVYGTVLLLSVYGTTTHSIWINTELTKILLSKTWPDVCVTKPGCAYTHAHTKKTSSTPTPPHTSPCTRYHGVSDCCSKLLYMALTKALQQYMYIQDDRSIHIYIYIICASTIDSQEKVAYSSRDPRDLYRTQQ